MYTSNSKEKNVDDIVVIVDSLKVAHLTLSQYLRSVSVDRLNKQQL